MFTGIITDVGEILEIKQSGDLWARIGCGYKTKTIKEGASIAHDGICLTVTNKGESNGHSWYTVDLSQETINKTYLAQKKFSWQVGKKVNLERSLKLGEELGGHILTGHIDGVAIISGLSEVGDSTSILLEIPYPLRKFIAKKGSISLNGTSLTVNEVTDKTISVNLIPHTKKVTTWSYMSLGDNVNLEVDLFSRYINRLNQFRESS